MQLTRKPWLAIVAGVLACVLVFGVAALLLPAPAADDCPHTPARLVSETTEGEIITYTYYCSACDSRYTETALYDAFAAHQPILNADQTAFTWSGNWTLGDLDTAGNYREFNTVHRDYNDTAHKWLIYTPDMVDPYPGGFWSTSAGYRITTPCQVGVARNYDSVIVWIAPADGDITIGATDFTINSTSTSYNLRLYLNGQLVYPAEGYLNIAHDGINTDEAFAEALADVALTVKEGDKLQFRCSRITQGMNEVFTPVITLKEVNTNE